MQTSKKAAFVVGQDPKQLIINERENRSWIGHRVAVLAVSPRADQLGLVLPAKAARNGAHEVRVPPQVILPETETVQRTALGVARSLLTVNVTIKDMQYLGSARGSVYRGTKYDPYGKWIHWVGVRLKGRNGVLNTGTDDFLEPAWWHTNQLLATGNELMSERKYLMVLQALATFNALGVDGQLTRRAKAQVVV
jgi:hypothetical protein